MTGAAVELADVQAWERELDLVAERIGGRFPRSETRDRVRAYLAGLLGPVQRKNAWQVAETIGEDAPYNVQYLLGRSRWEPDLVRDDLRDYVGQTLGDDQAVLVLDETGVLKKGDKSVGVARQDSGTAGRIENSQLGVFLAYASRHGTALIDRELYLPREWTDDAERCQAVGVPEDRTFATKPELALEMLKRTLSTGLPVGWVTGDEVYGTWRIRRYLEETGVPYVLAVRANLAVWSGFGQVRVAAIAQAIPARRWHTITIGSGSKGPRRYKYAWLEINHDLAPQWKRWLLVRRNLSNPEDLAYYIAAAPARTTLTKLATVAGTRWAIEGLFEQAKQEVGLADYETRSWTGWYRHITLSMLAHAVLAVVRKLAGEPSKKSRLRGPS